MTMEIQPEWLYRWERLNLLSKTIRSRLSYDTGGLHISTQIPTEWFTEYGEQVLWFSKNKPEQLIEFIYK